MHISENAQTSKITICFALFQLAMTVMMESVCKCFLKTHKLIVAQAFDFRKPIIIQKKKTSNKERLRQCKSIQVCYNNPNRSSNMFLHVFHDNVS